jgi:hypothetical protein
MHLVFVLPDLLALREPHSKPVRAGGLAALVALAGLPVRADADLAATLAARYGVHRQSDWPLAAIRVCALGIDPGEAYWLAADPVTFAVGRDDVRLAGVVDDLSRDDADALVATLNAHFAADGLAFVAPAPDAFFACVATRPALSTHALSEAAHHALRDLSPQGPDGAAWRRWQSEIQMLLFDHPVNVRREGDGLAPVHSVWFSCGGTLPPRPTPASSLRTFADAGVALALAAHAGSPARALPASLARAIAEAGATECVVVVLASPVDWEAFDAAWGAPSRDALLAARLETVSLMTEDLGFALSWRARRGNFGQRLKARLAHHDLAQLLAAVPATE